MPARAARQRHLAYRHAMHVSGSDSYALLYLLLYCPVSTFLLRSVEIILKNEYDVDKPAKRRESTEKRVEHDTWCPDIDLETVPTTIRQNKT